MEKIKILVAEDDPNIRMGLADTLESEGYMAAEAENGLKALELFESSCFDLILLDIMMPGKSGYDVCQEIRKKNSDIPVIMLTAKGEEIDKVLGLKLGADDYITKPFGIHELLARIDAVLRRTKRSREPEPDRQQERFSFGGFDVNTRTYKLISSQKEVDLTEREINLLKYFKSREGEVLKRDDLLNAVWGIDYYGTTRTLDQHIAQLRKKIEKNPSSPDLIKTVHGVGYRYKG